jgi:hypothetical protein
MKEKELLIQNYEDAVKLLPTQYTHPTTEVNIHFTLCGKPALKFDFLIRLASAVGITTQDMHKRIFERGVSREFEYCTNDRAMFPKGV